MFSFATYQLLSAFWELVEPGGADLGSPVTTVGCSTTGAWVGAARYQLTGAGDHGNRAHAPLRSCFPRVFFPLMSCCSSSCTFPEDPLWRIYPSGLVLKAPPSAASFPHGPTSCTGCLAASACGSRLRPSGLTSHRSSPPSRTRRSCSTASRSSAGLGSLSSCRARRLRQAQAPPPSKPWWDWLLTGPSPSSLACSPDP